MLLAGSLVVALLAGAGCTASVRVGVDESSVEDPWTSTVPYVDPGGRFQLDFPAAPEASEAPEGSGETALIVHKLHASVGKNWSFDLAWSDAPAGIPLVRVQQVAPDAPEAAAARDDGEVTERKSTKVFGLDALDFTVESDDGGSGLYRDREVVIGGRLYELTVIQRAGGPEAFDRFVSSFRLLEPPLQAGADFFAAASAVCQTTFATLAPTSDTATPAERGAAVSRGADAYVSIAQQLAAIPASADDQGAAAGLIDAIRRSIDPARRFAQAVGEDRADAEQLGRLIHADSDLAEQIAKRHNATACT